MGGYLPSFCLHYIVVIAWTNTQHSCQPKKIALLGTPPPPHHTHTYGQKLKRKETKDFHSLFRDLQEGILDSGQYLETVLLEIEHYFFTGFLYIFFYYSYLNAQ